MSKEQLSTEELNKSIDSLIDDIFAENTEDVSKGSPIDIAQDAQTTADAAANQAPKGQMDDARGAGRPAQISDVPQNDMDGRRESQYDASITENENKEDEPDETKQSPSMDQTQEKNRIADKPKAPAMRPFTKSESGEETPISDEEWNAFQEFKKSQAEAKEQEEIKKAEEMKKAEEQKQADLIKSAVESALEPMKKENESLRKSLSEQSELVKAMANQPQRPKSITGIEQLEKSQDPDLNQEPESFTKSDLKDAAFELAKSGKISENVAYEIDMTGTTMDRQARMQIEKYLQTGK